MINMIVEALIDRHSRLLDMARIFLTPSKLSKLNITKDQKRERHAPWIIDMLISHGIDIPEALELDRKSFYNFASMNDSIHINPHVASAFWDAGF